MAYKIMIVDDEPAAVRGIQKIIEKHITGFETASIAYSAVEALEKIPSTLPDIIFTDMKMPVMDGVAFIKKLNSEYPWIFPVVISGYQDFNYVKEALKFGVVDYLLKPVSTESLSELAESLKEKLDYIYEKKGAEAIRQYVSLQPVNSIETDKYLNCSYATPFIIRFGALSYHTDNPQKLFNHDELKSVIPESNETCHYKKLWILDGRDENEVIIVLGLDESIDFSNFSETLSAAILKDNTFHTIIYTSCCSEFRSLGNIIQNAFMTLKKYLVIGKNQIIDLDCYGKSYKKELPVIGSTIEGKLSFLAQKKNINSLKIELNKLFQALELHIFPQILLEKVMKQVLGLIEKSSTRIPAIYPSLEREQQLLNALELSNDFKSLAESVLEIAEDIVSCTQDNETKKDNSFELIEKVDLYIKDNMSAAISLESVCDTFKVSQPYLSRLFRKYKNVSLNDYVTVLRINEAKRLMKEHSELMQKDIAEIVGYQCQNYYSRVFKQVTGMSPTEYKKYKIS